MSTGLASELAAVAGLVGKCSALDVIALHTDIGHTPWLAPGDTVGLDALVAGYATALSGSSARLMVQEWAVQNTSDATAMAASFTAVASVFAAHGVPGRGRRCHSAAPGAILATGSANHCIIL